MIGTVRPFTVSPSARTSRESSIGSPFESGQSVREGEVLVELDTRQEHAQLASLEAQRDLRMSFWTDAGVVNAGVISRMDYDQPRLSKKRRQPMWQRLRLRLTRKTIRAPFFRHLRHPQVNLGQYLSSGGAIVPLQSLNPIYVNFGVRSRQPARSASDVRFTCHD